MSINITDKIYQVRGQKVMLDFDLAEIYGYVTKSLNRQVKNNLEKFEGEDFVFRLTKEEVARILRCKNCTSSLDKKLRPDVLAPSWGGTRYLPYAFTEQGIYMLMTVLKGELAVKQSRTLIRLFKSMKDYLMEEQSVVSRIVDNSKDIMQIKSEIKEINSKIANTVKKSDISPIFLDFAKAVEEKEYLFLNDKPIKAKAAYMKIHQKAKHKIYIIDNYVNITTLHLLQTATKNLEIILFTDNLHNYLRKSDLDDFKKERPDLKLKFIKTNHVIHDRFIIIDNQTIYQAGGSSKDAGSKISTIHEITDSFIIKSILNEVAKLSNNPELVLK